MVTFIHEAGWPAFVVLAFGLSSLFFSLRYAMLPRADTFALVVGFATATVIFGALGTVLGIQMSAHYIGDVAADRRWIFLVGLRESLNNLVIALVLVALDTLAITAGAVRARRGAMTRASALSSR